MVASHRANVTPNTVRDQSGARPPLYLAVDNTRSSGDGFAFDRPLRVDVGSTVGASVVAPNEPLPLVDALEVAVAEGSAWVRLGRQRVHNLVQRMGLSRSLVGSGPALMLVIAVVFGGLLAVRVSQGQPPSALAGQATSVDAVNLVSPIIASGDQVIVVQSGDSLWSIANDHFPGLDPRSVVDELVAANGGSTIEAGQQIVVPVTLIESGTLLD